MPVFGPTPDIVTLLFSLYSMQKEVEEERQAHVGQVTDLLCWVRGLQDRARGHKGTLAGDAKAAESSLAAQQVGWAESRRV